MPAIVQCFSVLKNYYAASDYMRIIARPQHTTKQAMGLDKNIVRCYNNGYKSVLICCVHRTTAPSNTHKTNY